MENNVSTNPRNLSIKDFSYNLPDDRIAKHPLLERDTSKMLVYKDGRISNSIFNDLPEILLKDDCIVFNDTRVIHARLFFQKETGARIEVFCLEPMEPAELTEAFGNTRKVTWRAMVGNAKRFRVGEVIIMTIPITNASMNLTVKMLGKENDTYHVEFDWDTDHTFAEVLEMAGRLPIPPYLNREVEFDDEERYQTLYAQADGSVAAPTAGLHFTQGVLDRLKEKGVDALFVTLHVGAGTFKPVKSNTMQEHNMHVERIDVSYSTIERLHHTAGVNRIVAVGTTSLRTIESIYWFGVKLIVNNQIGEFSIGQWEPYELENNAVKAKEALGAVLTWMRKNQLSRLKGSTQLMIAPGYKIRLADALITNFHQPHSTLLLLVASFVGAGWRKIYDFALANDFRFLSYGDSSILFRSE